MKLACRQVQPLSDKTLLNQQHLTIVLKFVGSWQRGDYLIERSGWHVRFIKDQASLLGLSKRCD